MAKWGREGEVGSSDGFQFVDHAQAALRFGDSMSNRYGPHLALFLNNQTNSDERLIVLLMDLGFGDKHAVAAKTPAGPLIYSQAL